MSDEHDPGPPPFEGVWRKREEMPGLLNDAADLSDIAWFDPWDPVEPWHTGITSQRPVQYWVRAPSPAVGDGKEEG